MPFRIRSILVTSDLSDSAEPVLRSAAALASLAEAQLHVVHAVESARRGLDAKEERGDPRIAASEALRRQLQAVIPPALRVASVKVIIGPPHHVILERAEEVHADLIVIGPHRERDTDDDRLGITADRLVRTSDVPCLIIHAPITLPLRSVCVPDDLSLAARGALDVALIWAAALRLPRSSGGRTKLHQLFIRADADSTQAVNDELARRAYDAGRRTGCATFLEIQQLALSNPNPAEEIVRFAAEEKTDLLVMGTHGQSALARELIGGVSSAVARTAECPVLLVPPATWKLLQARQEEAGDSGPR